MSLNMIALDESPNVFSLNFIPAGGHELGAHLGGDRVKPPGPECDSERARKVSGVPHCVGPQVRHGLDERLAGVGHRHLCRQAFFEPALARRDAVELGVGLTLVLVSTDLLTVKGNVPRFSGLPEPRLRLPHRLTPGGHNGVKSVSDQ
jgi:hypothetical protein